jgi:hypothetical protein
VPSQWYACCKSLGSCSIAFLEASHTDWGIGASDEHPPPIQYHAPFALTNVSKQPR